MNTYVTGAAIKQLREERQMTQAELAEQLGVSSKTISKWETAKGLPDIGLLQPLAQALGISVIELMNGQQITNKNISANLLRGKFYICPLCGNVIHTTGSALVSCCGITLPPLEPETADHEHTIHKEIIEDEYYVSVDHPMTKEHYISFLAAVSDQGVQFVRLYPEGSAEARFKIGGIRNIYAYCNRHGLFRLKRIRKSLC